MFFGKHAEIEVSQVVKTRGLQEEKREIVDIPTSKQGASWVASLETFNFLPSTANISQAGVTM